MEKADRPNVDCMTANEYLEPTGDCASQWLEYNDYCQHDLYTDECYFVTNDLDRVDFDYQAYYSKVIMGVPESSDFEANGCDKEIKEECYVTEKEQCSLDFECTGDRTCDSLSRQCTGSANCDKHIHCQTLITSDSDNTLTCEP